MGNTVRLSLLFLLIALTGGCAKKTLVAMVPDPDGRTGRIVVSNAAGSVELGTAYQASTVGSAEERPAPPVNLGKTALDKMFAEALSVQPERPLHFLLYFDKDTTLTCTSRETLSAIVAAIRERNSVYISVVGHTDTLGSKDYNMELSQKRARVVKDLLIERGVAANTIRTTSHGKDNPLIPTADNVYEPRNRRVEVVVR